MGDELEIGGAAENKCLVPPTEFLDSGGFYTTAYSRLKSQSNESRTDNIGEGAKQGEPVVYRNTPTLSGTFVSR